MQFKYYYSGIVISASFKIPFLSDKPNVLNKTEHINILFDDNLDCTDLDQSSNFYICNLKLTRVYISNIAYFEIKEHGLRIYIKKLKEFEKFQDIFFRKLLNHIIPYALYMSGDLMLHASAVSNKKYGVVFLGRSGSGKSSLSASLRGFNFLSEDSLRLKYKNHNHYIYPSYPYVNLKHNIARFLNLHDGYNINKSNSRATYKVAKFTSKKLILKKCYILRWSNYFKISEVSPKSILKELYNSSFGPWPLRSCKESQSRQFSQFMNLMRNVQFYLLERNIECFFDNNDNIASHINL